jgi:hypothetical protein
MPTNYRIAFVDESRRTNRYVLACAVIDIRDAEVIRRELRSLVAAPKRRIHFNSEPDNRRRLLLERFDQLPVQVNIHSEVIAQHQPEPETRALLLGALIPRLQALGISQLIIESRDAGDKADRVVINRVRQRHSLLVYEHRLPTEEPLLWLPDGYAWAAGRGPAWTSLVPNTLRG